MSKHLTLLLSITEDPTGIERIRQRCPNSEIRFAPWITDPKTKLDPALMKGVDAFVCEIPPANFDDFDSLRWMQLTSAGYAHILHLPLLERGIRVTNGLGNFDGPIAEWNLLMMLFWQRHMTEQLDNQKNHIWNPAARFQSDLFGSTIGFYGYGGIARETARLAKAMHLNVWVMTRDGTVKKRPLAYCVEGTGDPDGILPDKVFDPSRMKEFLGGLDYLLLTMPLTNSTKGLVGEKELKMLRPGAVVINPARAQIIDEEVFIRCLKEKWVRGVSLDVHYAYPLPPEHPLWDMPNLVMTPHISGSTKSPHFLARIYDIFSKNCKRYSRSEPLLNELTEFQLQGK
ncbi:MAG: D-2-hydroxyacid dehydrogenase [Chthoniobacterales bacterium]